METTRNLAMVFAIALRGAVQDLRGVTVTTEDDGPEGAAMRTTALESIEAVAEELARFASRAPDVPASAVSVTHTERGFRDYGAITDAHGARITIRESSSVEPHVWVLFDSQGYEGAAHLSLADAERLARMLHQAGADVGSASGAGQAEALQ